MHQDHFLEVEANFAIVRLVFEVQRVEIVKNLLELTCVVHADFMVALCASFCCNDSPVHKVWLKILIQQENHGKNNGNEIVSAANLVAKYDALAEE